ncbi:MAG: leucine-rich repeat protein [Oscillospiraceae bacterium]|nr:leucine-rich repeat protein [Oscillospiraceae bacterium]
MKRILALLLCFCLCVSLIPAAFAEDPEDIIIVEEEYLDEGDELIEIIDPELPAGEVNAGLPASGTCGGSLTWTLNEYGYLSIEGSGYMDDYDAQNPAPWQDWADYITDVSIGDNVRSIGSCAFIGLPNLENVQFYFDSCLEEIGRAAFADCVSLDHLYLPDGLGVIPRYLCSGCSALNYVIFPASLTTVCYGAFEDCWRLDSAFLPDSLEEIEPYAFARSGINYVNIPDSVSEIGTEAFMDCWFLQSVVIGSGVEEIGSWVFMGCDELEQVVFRGSVPDFDTFEGREENFKEVTIKAYYPAEDSSWTSAARRDYGGHITWKSYSNGLYIALQPLSQEVYVGHNAYLYFRIGCASEAVYKWQYKTADALDGSWKTLSDAAPFDYYSLGANLDLYDLPLELNGACFRCKVTSGGSTVYTNTIWLTVKVGDWPYIIRQPESAVAEPGETAVFDLEAGGKDLTYEWQYSPSNNPGTWFKSSGSGADTPTYSVVAKSFRDGYQYRCRIYNLTDTVYSNEVSLTVMDKPAITTQPKSITAASGDTATFKVTATGSDLSYQWQYRTSSSGTWKNSSGTGSNKASYPVSAASYRDGYQYRCKVSNAAGTATSSAATLTVVSMLKPKITTQPKDITTLTGNTVTFKVAATGGSLSYQWYYLSGPDATWVKCSGGTGASLDVEAKLYRSGYQYRCVVTNDLGSVTSREATLTVNKIEKPTITRQPSSVSVTAGKLATFSVTATGTGSLSYQWYYRKSSTEDWIKCTDGTGTSFTVEAKTYRNGYQYRCGVKNSAGTTYSNAATLTVKQIEKPTITSQPEDAYGTIGTDVSFTVSATGPGTLSYQWYYRATPDNAWAKCSEGTDATLDIAVKGYRDGYQYRCAVTNLGGTTYSEYATLYVQRGVIDTEGLALS